MQVNIPETSTPITQRRGWREVGGFVFWRWGQQDVDRYGGCKKEKIQEDTQGLVQTLERTLAHQLGETEGKLSVCDSPNHGLPLGTFKVPGKRLGTHGDM